MKRMLLAVAAVVIGGAVAEAGPWRRPVQRTTASACAGGSCATTRTVSRGGAQAHAEAMAARGVLVHASSHPGFEGVGVGPTPEAAIRSACNNGGAVLEEGVARGRDGRWYACRRYSVR